MKIISSKNIGKISKKILFKLRINCKCFLAEIFWFDDIFQLAFNSRREWSIAHFLGTSNTATKRVGIMQGNHSVCNEKFWEFAIHGKIRGFELFPSVYAKLLNSDVTYLYLPFKQLFKIFFLKNDNLTKMATKKCQP